MKLEKIEDDITQKNAKAINHLNLCETCNKKRTCMIINYTKGMQYLRL